MYEYLEYEVFIANIWETKGVLEGANMSSKLRDWFCALKLVLLFAGFEQNEQDEGFL